MAVINVFLLEIIFCADQCTTKRTMFLAARCEHIRTQGVETIRRGLVTSGLETPRCPRRWPGSSRTLKRRGSQYALG